MMKTTSAKLFILLALLGIWNGNALAATAPLLGAAESFAVLAGTSITNIGASVVTGELGVSPGATVTGFNPPGTVNGGTIHLADITAANAQSAATTSYNDLVAQACTLDLTGQDLGGKTLTPGVYCFTASAQLTGALTLNGAGVYIFQIATTLTTAIGSSVLPINGAQQSDVFWQIGSSATLGASTTFNGTIIALTSITLNNGATVSGRTFARTGTVTLDSNTVSVFPIISVVKSVTPFSDPVNVTTNPKAIPGSEMAYNITVTNSGLGTVDNGTTIITDIIPANMSMCVSLICNTPTVVFSCSAAPPCGLTYTYATDVSYSNQPGGGAPYTYAVVPDAAGYDPNVTGVRINPGGFFNGGSVGSSPSFTLSLKMKIN